MVENSQTSPKEGSKSGLSLILHGYGTGGVVGNATIASRLAQLLLEPLIGAAKLKACLPLIVEEHGDCWLVKGNRNVAGSGAPDICHLEIRKFDGAVSGLSISGAHNLLADATIAEKFTAAVLENTYGEARLQQQSLLRIEDQGESWVVRGSCNMDGALEGPGPFRLEVAKRDARVLEIFFEGFIHTPPDVQALLRDSAKRKP